MRCDKKVKVQAPGKARTHMLDPKPHPQCFHLSASQLNRKNLNQDVLNLIATRLKSALSPLSVEEELICAGYPAAAMFI